MEGALRRSLESQAQHTHSLEDHGLSNRAPPNTLNTSVERTTVIRRIFTNYKKADWTQFTEIHSPLSFRPPYPPTYTLQTEFSHYYIQGYNITLTTSQVQEIIKQSKNNNSQGFDKLNIRHLKHIGPLGLAFLASMFKTALNKNIIPHTWMLANIVPIPKPNKDTNKGTSYRAISILSVIAKTLE